ncbi:MAG: hypothetical protein ACPLKS_08260 [Caldisericum exile]|uniref:hypothetical protein n=1 Tax=Caldisericum exile TaxID=693075 RepID=UPI003C74AE2B
MKKEPTIVQHFSVEVGTFKEDNKPEKKLVLDWLVREIYATVETIDRKKVRKYLELTIKAFFGHSILVKISKDEVRKILDDVHFNAKIPLEYLSVLLDYWDRFHLNNLVPDYNCRLLVLPLPKCVLEFGSKLQTQNN